MILTDPVPFQEALDSRAARELLPTELRARLLEQIAPELRQRAALSARVTNGEFLGRAETLVDRILRGDLDRASARAQLKTFLDSIQYAPEPGTTGSLVDLSSDRRLNLILDTQRDLAAGAGSHAQGQDPAILDRWPAQELIRVIDSRVKRDWKTRFVQAGGKLSKSGRMIARKDAPVWTALSRFGLPYPPYDYNSGMDLRDIPREEAIAEGVIAPDEQVEAQPIPGLDRNFQANLSQTGPALRQAILDDLQRQNINATIGQDGVLRLAA